MTALYSLFRTHHVYVDITRYEGYTMHHRLCPK